MLSVIVPAYNEEKAIERTLVVLSSYLAKNFDDFEIVVVSDGSSDRTFEIAKRCQSESVKCFEYKPNRGKGRALRYGFSKTIGELIVFYDTGINFPPSEIQKFIRTLRETGSDLVIGSKRHPRSKVNYPFERRVMSFLVQVLVRILFNLKVTDTQVGLKAFRRSVLEKTMPRILVKRFAFDIELLALAQHYGFKIVEAPVTLDLKFSTAVSLRGKDSIWNNLVDTLAVFYRLKILHYYDLPEAKRGRLLREYRPALWARFIAWFVRTFGEESE